MKKINYFLMPLFLILSSCYIYKPYTEKEEVAQTNPNQKANQKSSTSIRGAQQPSANLSVSSTNKVMKDVELTDEDKQRMKMEEINRNQSPVTNNNLSETVSKEKSGRTSGMAGNMTMTKDAEPINTGKASRDVQPTETIPAGAGLKAKIQPNKYYKITVEDKEYKIQADKWEGDTLVSHILRKPNRVLRFHENQINEELLKERRFSKAYSDLFTVGAYAAGGAAVLLLLL